MFLAEKTALVTGASRGLGRAIALRLAESGAALAINYSQRQQAAESLASKIQDEGGMALAFQCDVANPEQVKKMVEAIGNQLGPIDILVNNAGILHRGDLAAYNLAAYEDMQRVNVGGVINATSAVVESMKERRFGRIINLTSVAAQGTALPGTTFYAATKAAVALLTRRFAMELGSFGVTVNAVAPGFIQTEMALDGMVPAVLQEVTSKIVKATMVNRIGNPEDVAHAVAFLASPNSGFITAQILTVDGGRMDYIAHP